MLITALLSPEFFKVSLFVSVELLNQESVVAYLIDKKVISSGDNPQVEVLTGGVSNVVLAITTSNQKLVLKQALAELAVSEKWEADQRKLS